MADLTTIDNVKAWTAQDQSVTFDDAVLSRLITAASAFITSYLSRDILSASYTETFNGNGQASFLLRNWPVTAVASVSIDGRQIVFSDQPTPTSPTLRGGFIFDETTIYLRGGYCFTSGVQNVVVEYTAGYTVVPYDIEQACIELVTWTYKERGREGQASKSIGNGQVVSFKITDLPPRSQTTLDQWRSRFPGWW